MEHHGTDHHTDDRPAARWAAAAYRHIAADGIGAEKLSASAVAPLVAAARGYESITQRDSRGRPPGSGSGRLNRRAGAQFKAIVGRTVR